MNRTPSGSLARVQEPAIEEPGPAETLYLGAISHYARTAAAVTMGYVELLEKSLGKETLAQIVIPGNGREKPCLLADLLQRIRCSQQRLVLALERLEREAEEREGTPLRECNSG